MTMSSSYASAPFCKSSYFVCFARIYQTHKIIECFCENGRYAATDITRHIRYRVSQVSSSHRQSMTNITTQDTHLSAQLARVCRDLLSHTFRSISNGTRCIECCVSNITNKIHSLFSDLGFFC